jgi:tetratricopeptide (TPR) repeat protein
VREKPTGSRVRPEDVDHTWPEIPEWVDIHDLGADVRADLRGLSKQGAEFVAGHLAAAGELAESDPEQAWEHARAARSQGGRVAVVRETVGLVAYRAGKWSEAIAELRAARRMAGGPGQLAVMADSERALGNPERAIDLSKSPEAAQLDAEASAELAIVTAGARSDLGQHEAALAALHAAARSVDTTAGFAYRVYYAYAAKLAERGKTADALTWFVRAADADADDESDAAERAAALADGDTATGGASIVETADGEDVDDIEDDDDGDDEGDGDDDDDDDDDDGDWESDEPDHRDEFDDEDSDDSDNDDDSVGGSDHDADRGDGLGRDADEIRDETGVGVGDFEVRGGEPEGDPDGEPRGTAS